MKKNFYKIATRIFFVALTISLLSTSFDANASHFRYGHLTWTPVPGSPNVARFTLVDAFRRSAYGAPVVGNIITETTGATTLMFGDGSSTPTLQYKVLALDAAEDWIICQALQPGSSVKTTIDHTYSGPTNGGNPWVAEINSSARTGVEVNNPNGGYQISTLVELSSGNSSPSSGLPPVVNLVRSASANFFVPGADADPNTTLRWRLATSAEAGGSGTFNQPAGLSIDPATGLVTWNNLFATAGQLYSCQVVIEDHNAQTNALRTQVAVDFLIEIVDCSPTNSAPAFVAPSPSCGNVFTVLAGSPLTFTVAASDADVNDVIALNTGGLQPGATLNPVLPASGNPVSTTFNWTPTVAQAGAYVITFFATDDCGSQALCAYTINVINCVAPTCNASSPVVGSCGTNILCNGGTGTASVTVTNGCEPFTYAWSGGGGTSSTASGLRAGSYDVTVTDANGSTTSCSVTLTEPSAVTATASSTNPLIFYGYAADQKAPITVTSSGGCGNRTNLWSMSRGILCNVTNATGDESLLDGWNKTCSCAGVGCTTPVGTYTGTSFSAILTSDANFTVVVTDGNGCAASSSVHIDAIDSRCFAGNSGNQKVQVCHHTGSLTNPYVTLCVDQNAVAELLSLGDCVGACNAYSNPITCSGYRMGATEEISAETFNVYPNPFSNKTTVAFRVPADGNAVVKVFDAFGQQVKVLFDGMATSGAEYKVEFDGSACAAGMYFYSITSNEMNETRKMQLVK
jgi:hypothetical protein